MFSLPNIQNPFRFAFDLVSNLASDWVTGKATAVQKAISDQTQKMQTCTPGTYSHEIQKMHASVVKTYSHEIQEMQAYMTAIYDAIHQQYQSVHLKYQQTKDKIIVFLGKNKATLFFLGCCTATAYFSPSLFFSTAVITVIFRVELALHLKNLADVYLRDTHNPFKLNPQYEQCVSALDITMETIAALDTIALGTIFSTNSWTVFLLPALGGIAAGNAAAKWGMNFSQLLS